MKPFAFVCLLALSGGTLIAAPVPDKGVVPKLTVWAGLGVTAPVVGADDVTSPEFFSISFSLVNDGDKTINPDVDSSQFFVNGKELKDWGFIVGNGPRGDDFKSLPPGACLRFGKAMGSYFTEPGVYTIRWKGKTFESAEVVFRVLPRK